MTYLKGFSVTIFPSPVIDGLTICVIHYIVIVLFVIVYLRSTLVVSHSVAIDNFLCLSFHCFLLQKIHLVFNVLIFCSETLLETGFSRGSELSLILYIIIFLSPNITTCSLHFWQSFLGSLKCII